MEIAKLLGNTNLPISDSLFNSDNIKYVNIFHIADDAISRSPRTEGEITFISNDVEGKKKFRASSIMEVIAQMVEFIETLR